MSRSSAGLEFLPGQRVLLNTRAVEQSQQFRELAKAKGFAVVDFPCLEIANRAVSDIDLHSLSAKDWLVFTSANGFQSFLKQSAGLTVRAKIACIGEKTSKVVASAGYSVEFTGVAGNSEDFAEELISHLLKNETDGKIHLIRGDLASVELPSLLKGARAKGAQFTIQEHVGYESILPKETMLPVEQWQALVDREPRTVLTFTSSQAVRNFTILFDKSFSDSNEKPNSELVSGVYLLPVVVIGPKTKATALELGFKRVVSASQRTIESLLAEVVKN